MLCRRLAESLRDYDNLIHREPIGVLQVGLRKFCQPYVGWFQELRVVLE
jgi:hypothetical protein